MRSDRQGRWWFKLVAGIVKPALYACTRRDWHGMDNIPRTGGVLLVANHVTVADPLTLAHAVYDGGRRLPRYLAKSELFSAPGLGSLLRKAGQIPVYRRTRNAADSLRDAEAALASGGCVIIYPEGTCTRDPDGWPMVSKTGVARLALSAGVPVIPVAHWGAHRILGYKSKRVHLFPPKLIQVSAGPQVDLSAYIEASRADGAPSNETLREVTNLLMNEVKQLLGEIRGETPPATFYDPRPAATDADDDTQRAGASPA